MYYKAVLFDLDGTLLDTLEDLANSMNRALQKHGLRMHPILDYRFMIGDGARVLASRAVPQGYDNQIIESVLSAFMADYSENWNVATRPYEGIDQMLPELEKRGLILTVLSNKPDAFTQRCVTELIPDTKFSVTFGERPGIRRKPEPDGALEIARIMGIDPSEFLYLGDTSTDMKTSVASGMYPVGVLWGFRSAEELKSSGARTLISHPLEILEHLR